MQEAASLLFVDQPVNLLIPPLALQQVNPFMAFFKLGAPSSGNLCWSSK